MCIEGEKDGITGRDGVMTGSIWIGIRDSICIAIAVKIFVGYTYTPTASNSQTAPNLTRVNCC